MINFVKRNLTLENFFLFSFSSALALSLFILERNQVAQPIRHWFIGKDHLLIFVSWISTALSFCTILFFNQKLSRNLLLNRFIFIFFLPAAATFYAIALTPKINPWLSFFLAFYLITISTIYLRKKYLERKKMESKTSFRLWLKGQGKWSFMFIAAVMIAYASFGIYNIGKFAAVDEALWTFDRIPEFWKDLGKANWNGTRVSDKPGVTVSLVSGIGMLFENPLEFKYVQFNGERFKTPEQVEKMNTVMRYPIFFLTVILIPLFYFFLEKISGKTSALFGVIFIGLAPPLIGMSRIINPDSLLWAFLPLSILAFLAYLKDKKINYLFASGILLGISLITKYIANVLFVYFFLLIFLEVVLNNKIEKQEIQAHLKKLLSAFGILVLSALTTLFTLYPAIWVDYSRILNATIYSEAFISTWPYFFGLVFLVILDVYSAKLNILSKIIMLLKKNGRIISIIISSFFLALLLFAALNAYLGMKFYNFEEILASPKSSYSEAGFWGVLFANFYPLFFGISPIALAAILFSNGKNFFGKFQTNRFIIYLEIFILVYYLGSALNKVASTVRYQIIIFPIALTIAAIESGYLADRYLELKNKFINISLSVLLLLSLGVLYSFCPFYLSYASFLLPNKYYLDQKDMGAGSYEAASYLNKLSDAEKLTIWADKSGVCTFFKGNCMSNLDSPKINAAQIDYFVISSGRENRTTRIVSGKLNSNLLNKYHLNELYEKNNPIYRININGRPGQYVKIIKAEN